MAKKKEATEEKSKTEEIKISTAKAKKPAMPKIYQDGQIVMHSSMITTENEFFQLWEGTKNARGVNLKKAYKKASAWRDKYK